MKLMQIISAPNPPFVPKTVSYGHGEVSRTRMRKTRLGNSSFRFGRLNHVSSCKLECPENKKRYVTEVSGHRIRRRKTRFLSHATSDHTHDSSDFFPRINGKFLGATLDAIYRYSRAYTLKGTVLSIISISLLAVQRLSDFTPSFLLGVFQAILGGCLANLYVVGINQLSDIDIDKVNKPYLPLASGELSVKTGVIFTSLYAILGFFVGWSVKSWPLKLGLFLWYAFGTAYSVHIPLLRWKRIPVLAALCIWSVQGAIVPILFHLHAKAYLHQGSIFLSKDAIFVAGCMSIYAIVIALYKDVPDVEGDKMNGINSLASQIGQKRVLWICTWLLETLYGMAILVGLSSTRLWTRSLMVISHSILGFILWRKANLIDLKNIESMESFYLFIWKLYYVENLLVPILRF